MVSAFVGRAVAATTQPSSRPSATTRPTQSLATLRQWVTELADTDPDIRDRARLRLMDISPDDLGQLRQAVADVRPLVPSQTAALREIVNQVYLTGVREEPGGTGGFLGVQPAPTSMEVVPNAPAGDNPPVGVLVVARVPGFCGYRVLEDGDIILRLTSDKTYEFHGSSELSPIVTQQRPGDTVTLDVLRRGKLLHLPITLDRKPAWAGSFANGDPTALRQRQAAEYWDRIFAPLVDDQTS